jgi:hypothetical protein
MTAIGGSGKGKTESQDKLVFMTDNGKIPPARPQGASPKIQLALKMA